MIHTKQMDLQFNLDWSSASSQVLYCHVCTQALLNTTTVHDVIVDTSRVATSLQGGSLSFIT